MILRAVYSFLFAFILVACSGGGGLKQRVLSGEATAEEVKEFAEQAAEEAVEVYSQNNEDTSDQGQQASTENTENCTPPTPENPDLVVYTLGPCDFALLDTSIYQASQYENTTPSLFTMPKTGQVLVTLRDNNAGWQSELYIEANGDDIKMIDDTRQGPLNVTSNYAFLKGTNIHFFIVTHTPQGEFIHLADSDQAEVSYDEATQTYTIGFEDIPPGIEGLQDPDYDYNDVVIEVQIVDNEFIDMSAYLDISIDYLNPHGFNDQGYAIYYIGEQMQYDININVAENATFGEQKHVVYALQEYFEDITCDRFWFGDHLRPPGEPREISVKKGDLLANQTPPQTYTGVTFPPGQSLTLNGKYTSDLSIVAGNNQTHIVIFRENEDGQVETTIYDNPEVGIYDPPPPN